MDAGEVIRRIKALVAMEPAKRPISIDGLERLSGVADNTIRMIAQQTRIQEKTRARLEKALLLVENDQVVYKRGAMREAVSTPGKVTIRPPQPPQLNVRRVVFTDSGPKIVMQTVNPHAFPEFPHPDKKSVKS